jgi:hypothetical protein
MADGTTETPRLFAAEGLILEQVEVDEDGNVVRVLN